MEICYILGVKEMRGYLVIIIILALLSVNVLSGCNQQQSAVNNPQNPPNQQNQSSQSNKSSIKPANQNPIANATCDKTSGSAPLTVSFYGTGTDSDGTIVSYHWSFADGQSSNEQNPTHTFTKSGNNCVQLMVTDNSGGTGFQVVTIFVNPESEQSYKSSCRSDITYQQLNSNANSYLNQRITYQGTIVQVCSSNEYRVDVGSSDIVYVIDNSNSNFIQDDLIQLWGVVDGYYSYTSQAGWQITIPKIQSHYMEKISLSFNIGQTASWKGIEVTVLSVGKTDSYSWTGYSGDVYYTTPKPGNTFVLISVKVKQTGSGSEYIYSGDFWLVDSIGNKYDYDSGTYSMDGGLQSTTIYQGQQTSGKILFQVPDSLNGIKVQYNFGSLNPILATWNTGL